MLTCIARGPARALNCSQTTRGNMATETAARTGQTDETNRLISSQKVDGTAVYNRTGDRLGDVDHMMIDKFTGQVQYAVMSCGGVMGMGGGYSPPPRESLVYDTKLRGYGLDADPAPLPKAPRLQS